MVDFELIMPPLELLGESRQGGQPKRIADWLLQRRGPIDVPSSRWTCFAYGGLVPSRTMRPHSLTTALERLDVLARLRELYPDMAIYAFNTIMRLSISAVGPETAQYWEAMRRYQELAWRVAHRGEDEFAAQVAELEASIPPEIMSDYRAARARNHQVTCARSRRPPPTPSISSRCCRRMPRPGAALDEQAACASASPPTVSVTAS